MKIESLIKRPGGTAVELPNPNRTYKFVPESGDHDDPHVAEVADEGHVIMLLRVPEGFQLAEGETAPAAIIQDSQRSSDQTLIGSDVHSAKYEIPGGSITLAELVEMAHGDSGLTVDHWNDLSDQERYDYIDATLLELKAGTESTPEKPTVPDEPAAPAVHPEPAAPAAPEATITPPPAEGNTGGNTTPDRKELTEQYRARFGKNPSTKMKVEDLIAALAEDE